MQPKVVIIRVAARVENVGPVTTRLVERTRAIYPACFLAAPIPCVGRPALWERGIESAINP